MKIAISLDSACDLPQEIIKENDFRIVPFNVNIGEECRLDGVDVTGAQILQFVEERNELPKTAAPSVETYKSHFENILKEYDVVIHYSISDIFSVAHANAITAMNMIGENRVHIIDTMSLSTGIALVGMYGNDLRNEGKTAEEIVELSNRRVPYVQASFTLDSLKLLHKGGRCSGVARFVSMTFGIKPSLCVVNGKLEVNKKYPIRKFSALTKKYVIDTLEKFNNPDKRRCFITHTPLDNESIIDDVKNMIKDKFDEIIISNAGATISSHCGRNTLGILYINDGNL